MRILITGGSGFLGINLIRYLLNHSFREIVVLDIAEFDYPESSNITFLKGDIRDPDVVQKAMLNIDVVIHSAAALPLYSKNDIYTTDVVGTQQLLQSAFEHRVDRFIMISSTAVYGIPDHHPLLETDPLRGVGYYGQAKVLAEKACAEFRNKGLCTSVLRPKSFIGPERLGVFSLFYDWAKDGKNFPIIGKGTNRYQLLDVEDFCAAILLCITKEKQLVNDCFNIGAEKFTTLKEDFQAVLNHAGYGKKIMTFPAAPAIFFLKLAEFLKLSPVYQWVYETANKDSFISIEKAKSILGFQPKFSNQDALLRNFEWYLNNLDLISKQTGISHRSPWKQGVLKILKKIM